MPIWRFTMNSSRASPTPAFGRREKENACSGLPTFIMIFVGSAGIESTSEEETE